MSGLLLVDRTRTETKNAIYVALLSEWGGDVDLVGEAATETAEIAVKGLEASGMKFKREAHTLSANGGLWKQ